LIKKNRLRPTLPEECVYAAISILIGEPNKTFSLSLSRTGKILSNSGTRDQRF